jgi:hypothetical protein
MPQYFFTVRRSEVEMKYPNGVMLPNNAIAIGLNGQDAKLLTDLHHSKIGPPVSVQGHSRPGPTSSRSNHVRCSPIATEVVRR